jgi:hypothetical protein
LKEFERLKEVLVDMSDKEYFSLYVFIKWESDFINMISEGDNPFYWIIVESNRITRNLFNKIKRNFMRKVWVEFDKVLTESYYNDIRKVFGWVSIESFEKFKVFLNC